MDPEAKTRRIAVTPRTFNQLGERREDANEPLGDVVTRLLEETSKALLKKRRSQS